MKDKIVGEEEIVREISKESKESKESKGKKKER